jgi:hypothetical protein
MTYLTNLCFRREMQPYGCPGWSSGAMGFTTNAKNASKRVKEKPQLDEWETFSL